MKNILAITIITIFALLATSCSDNATGPSTSFADIELRYAGVSGMFGLLILTDQQQWEWLPNTRPSQPFSFRGEYDNNSVLVSCIISHPDFQSGTAILDIYNHGGRIERLVQRPEEELQCFSAQVRRGQLTEITEIPDDLPDLPELEF